MSKTTQAFAKGGIATAAVGALALAGAAPAQAKHRDDKIDAGDVIAGALIIGGLAAILGSSNKNDRYRDNYRYRDRDYRPQGNPERAIQKCIRAVERDARRAGYRFADVTEIRDVDRERRGWEIRGRLVLDDGRGGYRGDRYRDRNRYDNRGDADNHRGQNLDRGRFKCEIQRGRVVGINYRGLRYLD